MHMLEAACLCLITQGMARAQSNIENKRGGPSSPTEQELKSLPPYCTARLSMSKPLANEEQIKRWQNILGDAFLHIHHYCNGLNFLNRIHRAIGDKNYLLGRALQNFQYMYRIPENHFLRPELELNIGQVHYMADQIPQAMASFRKAIQMKPSYERAYLLLSFCFRRVGDRTSAVRALQEGLTKVPDSRALQNALRWMNSANDKPAPLRIDNQKEPRAPDW